MVVGFPVKLICCIASASSSCCLLKSIGIAL